MTYLEIIIVLVLTGLNGLLAMSELAVASSRLPKLRLLAGQRVHGARRALALASDPGRFLSTVQIGITLIGILAGVVSGASLGARTALWLESQGLGEAIAEPLAYSVVIGAITFVSLILGELVPKQIAIKNPERIACLVAPAMTLLAHVSSPLVWFLDRAGRLVLALLGQSPGREQTVTDAEIHSLIAEAETAGVIEPEERSMIAGIMRLGDRPVRSVMIPRTDVKMIDVKDQRAALAKQFSEHGYSRYVVYDETPDNILGLIQATDVATALLNGRKLNIRDLVKQAPVIPDTVDALDVLAKLKESGMQVGLVYDEYGHFEGIVTAADILEAIAGAFKEENRPEEPPIIQRADGSLLVAGWSPIDALLHKLLLPVPARSDYHTVAGFVLDRFGRLPAVGDSFDEGHYNFEVVDMDGRRVDKVLVTTALRTPRRQGRGQ